jgi:hypothetical protein
MTASRARRRLSWLLGAALLVALSPPVAVLAQTPPPDTPPETSVEEAPKSLLPAGRFNPAPAEPAVAEPSDGAPAIAPLPQTEDGALILPEDPGAVAAAPRAAIDLQRIGTRTPARGGMPDTTWARSNGADATRLIWGLAAPGPSRWANLTMVRLLTSTAAAPPGVDAMAFLGARARWLTRAGFPGQAQALLGQVPVNLYPRGLYTVAAQAHLAGFDLAATCPLATNAVIFGRETFWPLLLAICSALQTDDEGAALGLDLARQDQRANAFDVLMADRVVTAVSGGGGAGMLNWPRGGVLTSFRLAAIYASGQSLPAWALLRQHAGVHGWIARSSSIDSTTRKAAGYTAVTTGALTVEEWSTLWAARAAGLPANALAVTSEGLLVRAWQSPSVPDRIRAMRALWERARTPRQQAALRMLTGRAAATLPVRPGFAADVPDLVRSMLLAGEWQAAQRWGVALASHARQGEDGAAEALTAVLPLLELTDWPNRMRLAPAQIEAWVDLQGEASRDDQARRGGLLVAALQGLRDPAVFEADLPGRVMPDADPESPVLRRLAAAGQRGARGDVVLLAAQALGTQWSDVTPETLRTVVGAYARVGLAAEARLIALEAIIAAGG